MIAIGNKVSGFKITITIGDHEFPQKQVIYSEYRIQNTFVLKYFVVSFNTGVKMYCHCLKVHQIPRDALA